MCFERFKYVISYSEQLTSLVNPMFFVNLTLVSERHPSILSSSNAMGVRGSPSKLHPILTAIFYNCTLENMYRGLAQQAKKDHRRKDKIRYREAKQLPARLCCWDTVSERAMHEHLTVMMSTAYMYSCPLESMRIQALEGFMSEPTTAAARDLRESALDVVARGDDLLTDMEDTMDRNVVYFQPIVCNISKNKLLRLPLGVSGRFNERQILVALHNRMTGFGDEVVLQARAAASAGQSPVFIMEKFTVGVNDVCGQLLQHRRSCQHWTIPDCTLDDEELSEKDMCMALQEFMLQGAYPGGRCAAGIALMGKAQRCAAMLHRQGCLAIVIM